VISLAFHNPIPFLFPSSAQYCHPARHFYFEFTNL